MDCPKNVNCRESCAACCIAASINHSLPGMPLGKPAGVVCANLDLASRRCRIWGTDEYPDTCRKFIPEPSVCGTSREEALMLINDLERATAS
jgi:hypothetical protein